MLRKSKRLQKKKKDSEAAAERRVGVSAALGMESANPEGNNLGESLALETVWINSDKKKDEEESQQRRESLALLKQTQDMFKDPSDDEFGEVKRDPEESDLS